MLEEAFELPEEDDFITVPEGVTEEQLIEEAKQYVDAIIVTHHKKKDSPSVFLKTGDSDEVKAESDSNPKDGDKSETPDKNTQEAPDNDKDNKDDAETEK